MNKKLSVNLKTYTPAKGKLFRKGNRQNLRSSKMSTTATESPAVLEASKLDNMEDKDHKETTIVTDDIAHQILNRKEQEYILRNILPLSQNLKDELLNGVPITTEQGRNLATKQTVFKTMKIENDNILYFMGEFIHEGHLFGT